MSYKRYIFIDHLRGFVFALMAFDHALHAYASHWAPFWFFRDFDRTDTFDALYLFDQSIIMPMLFFIIGMFVLPSFERNGFIGYYKKRLIKLGIPFIIGVIFIVPLLTFPKFHEYVDPNPTYWEYWTQIFFSNKLQAGPFWVLYAILLYSTILILLSKIKIRVFLVASLKFIAQRSLIGIGVFILISAIIYGVSDLIWGAPWWIGFGKLFYLQGSRFIMNFVYFLMGAGLMASGLLDNKDLWDRFAKKVPLLGVLMVAAGITYSGFSLFYFEQAYSETPDILVRTTLLAILGVFQVLFLLAFFYRYFNEPTPLWQSLAKNGYGIFLFHEAMVVWLQFFLVSFAFSPYLKMPIVFVLGFGAAWLLNDQLRKLPGFKAVLN